MGQSFWSFHPGTLQRPLNQLCSRFIRSEKDFATLETFILHSENDNFIDIKCDLTIESPELRLWMSYLGEAHHDLGVRILNRVMAVCLSGSGVAYAVKRNEQDLTGPLRPVIDYWSKDSLANALRTFH